MNLYGKVKGHDFWVLLSSGQSEAQVAEYKKSHHLWDEIHSGNLPEGQQTIGQKLGYVS